MGETSASRCFGSFTASFEDLCILEEPQDFGLPDIFFPLFMELELALGSLINISL